MAKKAKPRITAWSISRLYDYERCPRKAKYKIIDRLEDGGSPAMSRGTELHAAAEAYIRGLVREIPPDLQKVTPHLRQFKRAFGYGSVSVEKPLAFNRRWVPVEWTAPDAWLRMKIDVVHRVERKKHLRVVDWKTGQLKPNNPDYADQLNLYATATLLADATKQSSTAELIFTDHGSVVHRPEGELDRSMLKDSMKKWEARTWFMLEDTHFDPKPGMACRWCPFSRSKGGPCEF